MKRIVALAASAVLMIALASVAFAHAEIKSCVPEIDGTVETAPTEVVCTSSQGMDATGSSLQVFDADGMQVDKGDSHVDLNDPDRTKISVSLDTSKMSDGVYTVKWTTVSADDGDTANGAFKFTVGHAMHMDMAATPQAAATGQAPSAAPTEAAATPAAAAAVEVTHPNNDPSVGVMTIDGKTVTLKLVSPTNHATLPAGDTTVTAEVDGVTLGENGAHVHFFVDGNLMLMGAGAQTSATLALEPGEHELMITLSDSAHDDLGNAKVHVTVQAATAPAATLPATGALLPTGAWVALAAGGLLLLMGGALVFARKRR